MSETGWMFSAIGAPDLMAPDAPVQTWKPWLHDVLIIAAAVLVLFCIVLALIWIIRGKRNSDPALNSLSGKAPDKGWLGLRKRHRKYKRRFPTLAETGGLPPKRTEQGKGA